MTEAIEEIDRQIRQRDEFREKRKRKLEVLQKIEEEIKKQDEEIENLEESRKKKDRQNPRVRETVLWNSNTLSLVLLHCRVIIDRGSIKGEVILATSLFITTSNSLVLNLINY